jgi:Mn-dependent DtxR family transcriptional regulator
LVTGITHIGKDYMVKRVIISAGHARELNLSVPVVARHVKILEREGLIERKSFSRIQVPKFN